MAINPLNGKTTAHFQRTNLQSDKKNTSEIDSAPVKQNSLDQFDASSVTQKIKQALESSPSTPVINEEKITAVKAALQAGNYQIDADSIAEKMLQFDNPSDSA